MPVLKYFSLCFTSQREAKLSQRSKCFTGIQQIQELRDKCSNDQNTSRRIGQSETRENVARRHCTSYVSRIKAK